MSPTLSSIINFKSFQTEKAEWKHFGRIVFLTVSIPLFLALILCEFLCWESGELVSDYAATQRQIANPQLEWLAHRDVDAVRYKLLRVEQEHPEVLVMGQSRMAQFRAPMFQPYTFYNLSRISWPLNTFTQIVQHLPVNYSPRIIIFDLDYYMFNATYSLDFIRAAPRFHLPPWEVHLFSLRDALNYLSKNPLYLFRARADSTIGLHATLFHHGFRKDGSVVWAAAGDESLMTDANLLADTQWNHDALTYGDSMDSGAEADLENFLRVVKARGITAIGIQMPMYGPVVKEIERSPHFGILRDFRAHVASGYFDRNGLIFFDYLEFPPYGNDYHYFADQIHPTEAVCAAILLKMSKDPRVHGLLPKLDTDALRRTLSKDKTAKQHFDVY